MTKEQTHKQRAHRQQRHLDRIRSHRSHPNPHPRLENGRPSNAPPSLPDSARNRLECYHISTTTERMTRRQVQKKELRRSQRRTQRNCPRRTTQTHLHLHSPHHSPRPATSERHHRRPKHKRPPSKNGGARAKTATRGVRSLYCCKQYWAVKRAFWWLRGQKVAVFFLPKRAEQAKKGQKTPQRGAVSMGYHSSSFFCT